MQRSRSASIVFAFGVVGVAIACFASCLEPTEVWVDVSTKDVCDLAEVKILKNGVEVASTKPANACNKIGSLVFIPTRTNGRFIVEVQGLLPGGDCKAGTGCVVARRSVTFQSHATFKLPITLSRKCLGVMCRDMENCNELTGLCEPIPSGCKNPPCDEDASMPDAALDSPDDAGDTGLDTGLEAGPTCTLGTTSVFSYGTLLHWWNFDEGMSPIHDLQMNNQAAQVPGYVFNPSLLKPCGYVLSVQASSQTALGAQAGIGITTSMMIKIPQGNTFAPILSGVGALNGSWDLTFTDNGSFASPLLIVQGNVAQPAQSITKIPYDGNFHMLEISMAGMSAAFSVDGSQVDVVSVIRNIADSQNLQLGTSTKIEIDELKIYKGATY